MKRYDIATLIFKELKKISPNSPNLVFSSIKAMSKGKYNFDHRALKNISRAEILLNLEKVLIQGCKTYNPKLKKPYYIYDKELFYDYAAAFATVIDEVKYHDVSARNRVYYAYDFMVRKAKLAQKIIENPKKSLAVPLCILAIIALTKMSFWGMDSVNMIVDPDEPVSYTQEEMIDDVEVENEEITDDKALAYEDINQIEATPNNTNTEDIKISENKEEQVVEEKLHPDFPCDLELIIDWICKNFDFNREEFDIFAATVIGEARPYDPYSKNPAVQYQKCYDDAYDIMSTIFNRTNDDTWIWTNEKLENLRGRNMYDHILPDLQFQVYYEGTYVNYLGKYDSPQFEAVIDFFITQVPSHNYLKYYYSQMDMGSKTYMQRDPYSNRFWDEMKPENYVEYEPVIFDLVSEDVSLVNSSPKR